MSCNIAQYNEHNITVYTIIDYHAIAYMNTLYTMVGYDTISYNAILYIII